MCCFVGGCGEGFFYVRSLSVGQRREKGEEQEDILSVWMDCKLS